MFVINDAFGAVVMKVNHDNHTAQMYADDMTSGFLQSHSNVALKKEKKKKKRLLSSGKRKISLDSTIFHFLEYSPANPLPIPMIMNGRFTVLLYKYAVLFKRILQNFSD